jgi:hypothetical protein
VQVSADGGANWNDLFTEPGNGSTETSFTPHTLSLSNYSGTTILLRFNFDFQSGNYYNAGSPIGWFFTGIVITNTQTLLNQATNFSSATNLVPGNLADHATGGLVNFSISPPPYYYIITNPPVGPETACFHLTHLDPASQLLQFNEILVPSASSAVSFASQLGAAASDETARVQASTNNGATWDDLFVEAGTGSAETSFSPRTLSLASYAGQLTLLRFNFAFTGGSYYSQSDNFIGWNIEDIVVTNTLQQVISITNTTNFTFAPPQAGTFILQAQPVIFSQFPLPFGPLTRITAESTPAIIMSTPKVASGQVLLNFQVSNITNITPATFLLLQANTLAAAWITNTTASFTTNTPGTSYRFTTTNGSATQYYLVKKP